MKILWAALLGSGFLALGFDLAAAEKSSPDSGRYRIFPRDAIQLTVHGEPDVGGERRVDGQGEINVPLIGPVKIAGLTPAEAQLVIAKKYIEAEIFIRPEVVVTVSEYSPKEVMVLGQVGKQGKQIFSSEATTLPIVEAITAAGGFTRIAKADAVRVTRRDERGNEQSFTINVEKMIEGRSPAGEGFVLQPGDVVFVPERVF